jgi:hypothetical protein
MSDLDLDIRDTTLPILSLFTNLFNPLQRPHRSPFVRSALSTQYPVSTSPQAFRHYHRLFITRNDQTMSLTEGFVSGWVPSFGDDDDVDISNSYPVTLPDQLLSSPSLSRASSNDSHSHHFSSIENAPSPGSSVDGSHTDTSYPSFSSSDRRAIRNRQRDPDWVPRPRNAFIIFRCEYSRKHARDSNDPSDKSSRSDKTLSKRAAEEWRCLSAEGREQYKILAEQEKAAHALQNPDYRFKPVRRTPPGVPSRTRPSTCRRTDRSAQVASLIMRSERGVSSLPRDGDVHEHNPEPATAPVSSSTVVIVRRRSSSMPQPVAAPEAVVFPAKARTPVPTSCMSSPGPSVIEFDRLSCSEIDSPLYTPVLPTSPALHGLPSGFQMMTLPELQSPTNEAFECCMGVGGIQVCFFRSPLSILHIFTYIFHQNSSAPVSATSGAYTYSYTDSSPCSSSDQYDRFTFADGQLYPASLEFMTSPSCAEWACCAPTAKSCLALAPCAGAALPKSPDTGPVGSFGPPPFSIPYGLQQHTTNTPPSSALHEIPANDWDICYAGSAAAANGAAAIFGCGAPSLSADVAEATVPVPTAGYDMAATQAGLDEFINAF